MQRFDHRFRAMGGPACLRLDSDNEELALAAIASAQQELQRLERKYSRYLPGSVTSRINRSAGSGTPTPIDEETAGLLNHGQTLWRESGGLFDLTSGVLRRAWDFRSGRLPSEDEIHRLLPLVGWERLQWDADSAYLPQAAMELDFGGCVKEYAADSAAAILRAGGIRHGLVDMAGDIVVTGPPATGGAWPVGIRNPARKQEAVAMVSLSGGSLASSGDYERCMTIGGQRYGHILNPATGWPVRGLGAVSVLAPQCLVAGSAATLALLKPADEALSWLAELGLPWLAVDREQGLHGTLVKP